MISWSTNSNCLDSREFNFVISSNETCLEYNPVAVTDHLGLWVVTPGILRETGEGIVCDPDLEISALSCLTWLLSVHTDEKADKCPALSSLDYHLIHQSSRILYSFYHFKWNVLRTSLKISSPFSRWCSGSTSSWWNSSHILQEANYKTRGQWQHSGVPLCHCGRPPAPDHVVPQRCQGARHWQVPGKTILLLYHQIEGGNLWSF